MGDVFEMLQDFLLGVTQWQILTYMKVLNQFMDNQEAYLKIYRVVGELDAAISTGSIRKSLPLVTVPEYEEAKQLEMEEIYHPLLHGAVTNSMELQHNCIITGSNASGKSTFIKTIAVNVILAQSIHTCTAKRMHLPHAKMITSMAVRHDILSGDSYFIIEITSNEKWVGQTRKKMQKRKDLTFTSLIGIAKLQDYSLIIILLMSHKQTFSNTSPCSRRYLILLQLPD